MSDEAGFRSPTVPPDTIGAHVAARTYGKAIGLFLLICFPAQMLSILVPDWPLVTGPLRSVVIFVASMAAGGMWQGFRGFRQWVRYVTLAVVAWIATLLVLMAGIVAVASWFLGSFELMP